LPQRRFLAVWVALALLLLVSFGAAPASLTSASLVAVAPFAVILALAAVAQSLVIRCGGIDLSGPAVIGLSGALLLGFSDGLDAGVLLACCAVALGAGLVGLGNGLLVAGFGLSSLVVTLAMGSVVGGLALWYQAHAVQASSVPPGLASFGAADLFGINLVVLAGALVIALVSLLLQRTPAGRRFTAAGASPRAARVAGLRAGRYQLSGYVAAALLNGLTGVLLAAFLRNPTLRMGDGYLLSPIAAVVLGGASLAGGVGSVWATVGAALFLTQLDQLLRVLGSPSSTQMILQGLAIAVGMALASAGAESPALRWWRRSGWFTRRQSTPVLEEGQ